MGLAVTGFGAAAPSWSAAAETNHAPVDLSKLPPPANGPVEFARDIEPLFREHCHSCHGAEKQKGGLRLDHPTPALQGGDGGKVIIPGAGAESRLIHLVAGLEPDETMPPKGKPLSTAEVGALRAWIDAGAEWPHDGRPPVVRSDHWAFQPIRDTPDAGSSSDAIDAFVIARLRREGLTLSPEADRSTLARRLAFDLTGLPPAPEEIAAFVQDASPNAYSRLVERLLASPHYGERWGRHWLDIARFTESHGFEYDKLRPNAWHYRDYVIESFNADKPYDRFMREQVAGDVMEPATRESVVAASLLVCGPWDEAGSSQANATQRAITREDEMEDLLAVVGQSFLGLTINCARCHAHKTDPIPQEDYYRMKAVFDGVRHGERPLPGDDDETDIRTKTRILAGRIEAARKEVAAVEAVGAGRLAARTDAVSAPVPHLAWDFTGGGGEVPAGERLGSAGIDGGRLRLPDEGAWFQSAPIPHDIREKTLEAWVSLDRLDQGGGAAIAIESGDGRIFDAIVFAEREPGKWMVGSDGFARTVDLDAPEETVFGGALVHLAAVFHSDNSIVLYRNGEPLGERYATGSPLQTYAAGDARVLLGRRHSGGSRAWLTGEIARAALHDRALSAGEVADSFAAGGSIPSVDAVLAELTPAERASRDAARTAAESARRELEALKAEGNEGAAVSYAGTRSQPPPTRRLIRGEVTMPDEMVSPGGLVAIPGPSPDFGLAPDAPEAERRLKFAEWLADPRNPLPARVMANRVWHYHFGLGLVATPNDFGVGGVRPTHPELLDWLASRFVESGWSVKALHRLIVHSAVYRQGSGFVPAAAALDADNTLLWRYSPRRLEGEAVRDAMLVVSGQLNPSRGGPSFQPFDVLPFPANAYAVTDKIGPDFNRRTVYRMNVNSGKDPLLDAFDCPDPSVKTPRRGVTTTPLQALALMNGSFVQRQAEHLAERAARSATPEDPADAVRAAWRIALGRSPSAAEVESAVGFVRERGLAALCWVLINSTEFVHVR